MKKSHPDEVFLDVKTINKLISRKGLVNYPAAVVYSYLQTKPLDSFTQVNYIDFSFLGVSYTQAKRAFSLLKSNKMIETEIRHKNDRGTGGTYLFVKVLP